MHLILFPGRPVCGCYFPGVGVHAQRFEVVLAGVLVLQLRASGWSLPCHQLTIEKVLGDASVFHAVDVAQPSHASHFRRENMVRMPTLSSTALFVTSHTLVFAFSLEMLKSLLSDLVQRLMPLVAVPNVCLSITPQQRKS